MTEPRAPADAAPAWRSAIDPALSRRLTRRLVQPGLVPMHVVRRVLGRFDALESRFPLLFEVAGRWLRKGALEVEETPLVYAVWSEPAPAGSAPPRAEPVAQGGAPGHVEARREEAPRRTARGVPLPPSNHGDRSSIDTERAPRARPLRVVRATRAPAREIPAREIPAREIPAREIPAREALVPALASPRSGPASDVAAPGHVAFSGPAIRRVGPRSPGRTLPGAPDAPPGPYPVSLPAPERPLLQAALRADPPQDARMPSPAVLAAPAPAPHESPTPAARAARAPAGDGLAPAMPSPVGSRAIVSPRIHSRDAPPALPRVRPTPRAPQAGAAAPISPVWLDPAASAGASSSPAAWAATDARSPGTQPAGGPPSPPRGAMAVAMAAAGEQEPPGPRVATRLPSRPGGAPPAPAIDIESLVDQVQRRLSRQAAIDRERKGYRR